MDVFKNVADSVTKAVNFVVDKNRRAAMINRLKIVIRNEKEIEARAYIELGKYYYENLRDPSNGRTEPLCAAVENSDRRLKRAFSKLDELLMPAGDDGTEEGRAENEAAPDGGESAAGDGNGEAKSGEDAGDDFFHTFSAASGPQPDGEAADDGPAE